MWIEIRSDIMSPNNRRHKIFTLSNSTGPNLFFENLHKYNDIQ